jgi:diadenosine tetraphosphatase ApaH/serine/threonine PP2A family protein phosphatase
MMLALISDIHSNTEALAAVLADIDRQEIRRILCLGDVIGYGPEPRETLEKVMERCEVTLLGNHEHGAMFYASDFNPKARAAIEWTKARLNDSAFPRDANFRLWNYISEMPETKVLGDVLLVHGSPKDPVRDYTLPGDVADGAKMRERFERMGNCRVCFVGHSHLPGVYEEGTGFKAPRDLGGVFRLGERKAIVNIGSVGQPRDGDPRASYCTYDEAGRSVSFHRIAYDVQSTQAKIRKTELPDYLAERLALGR